jgi:thioredoxin-related protein
MKIAKIAFLLLTAASAHVQAGQDSIYWETNLASAYKEALDTHKPLVVYFRDDSCFFCSLLDAQLNVPATGVWIASSAVFVRVTLGHDDDKGNVGRMAAQLNIKKGPTFVVVDVSPSLLVSRGQRIIYTRDEFLLQITRLIRSGN